MLIFAIIFVAWGVSGYRFSEDVSLFNKIRSSKLDETKLAFNYENQAPVAPTSLESLKLNFTTQAPSPDNIIAVNLEKGDTTRAVAHRLADVSIQQRGQQSIPYAKRSAVDAALVGMLQTASVFHSPYNSSIQLENSLVQSTIDRVLSGGN